MTRDEALGVALREARQAKKLSQRVVADRASLTVTYLSLVENAKRSISASTLFGLADALGTTASELIRRAEALAEGSH